jgi:glycosyltransferase involved in cell wall biosynthesis
MPAYNEEDIIEKSVRDFYNEIVNKIDDSELIVVDDWSTDDTPIILKNLKKDLPKLIIVKTPRNSGHGKAMLLGLETAGKDFIFQTDSDYQHDPKEFWKLYPYMEHYDIVLGYRKRREDTLVRKLISRFARLLNSMLFGVSLHDTNCPFRIYRRSALKKIFTLLDKNVFAPAIHICIIASHLGMSIKEIGVTHYPRTTGKVSIMGIKLLRICIRCVWEIVCLKKKLRVNR